MRRWPAGFSFEPAAEPLDGTTALEPAAGMLEDDPGRVHSQIERQRGGHRLGCQRRLVLVARRDRAGSSIASFSKRGYTVFAVVHGSQPRYTIPEVVADMNRAVRFIRYHAERLKIDPDRIGITGGSAGGHLSLMQGTAGNRGQPDAKDPIDRTSSRVQAVACFFPPTDFLNYGKPGENALGRGILKGFKAAVRFPRDGPQHEDFPCRSPMRPGSCRSAR